MNDPTQEQTDLEEAQRLAKLPVVDQKAVLALHRSVADNPKVPKADRQEARRRADALEKHLRRLNRKPKKKP